MLSLPTLPSIEIERLQRISGIEEAEFLDRARLLARQTPSAVLLSGGDLRASGENRYSIAAWKPLVVMRTRGDLCRVEFRAAGGGGCAPGGTEFRADPLSVLDRLFEALKPSFGMEAPPFSGGAVGYLAYDLKNMIERLPALARDDLELPDIFLFWPGQILVHDREQKELSMLELKFRGNNGPPFSNHGETVLAGHEPPAVAEEQRVLRPLRTGGLRSNFTHEDYLAAVGKIRSYIRRGDVYQVNLSQRFEFELDGDPYRLWQSLFDLNPAPFYAFVNAGDHQVLSTSMERFLLRRGPIIETRPIKGTRKRGQTREEDAALVSDLLQSPKDDAELSMIVDLLRNDLGRVCLPKTIRVAEHKRVETYQNVHHLVSIVTGELLPGTTHGGIIRATFPGGSITGCPKIRSMEIIDELEPNVRHVYTGAVGYLGWHDNLDLSVAIRTAIVKGRTCYFSVGGGVVYDSVEEDEYQETLHKGRTLFDLIRKPEDVK